MRPWLCNRVLLQGKLDGYRAELKKGKTLNEDQKAAIEKYDEVMIGLEYAREMTNQFKTLAVDDAKARKKAAKKEQQERYKADVAKVAETLEVQVGQG